MPERVYDEYGRPFELLESLGKGGQGEVFAVAGRLAIKLIGAASPRKRHQLKDQLRWIRNLPEINGLIKPKGLLREPDLGYWMELKSDCIPISRLIKPPGREKPTYAWYDQAGGLKKRMRVLTRLAGILGVLHGYGIAYSDLSDNNVLISQNPLQDEVWLIDTDNLRRESHIGDGVHTKGYAAPEVLSKQSPVNTLSDAHAFAVLAFKVLTGTHPLIGDHVENGEPELEEQALKGLLPWIDDLTNDLNRSSHGIPREQVLSGKTTERFHEAFTAGLTNPAKRPSVNAWFETLHLASSRILTCPNCQHAYFSNHLNCPNCKEKAPKYVQFSVHSKLCQEAEEKLKGRTLGAVQKPINLVVIQEGTAVKLNAFELGGWFDAQALEPILELKFMTQQIGIRTLSPQTESISLIRTKAAKPRNLKLGPTHLPLSEFDGNGRTSFYLEFQVDANYQREGKFRIFGETP